MSTIPSVPTTYASVTLRSRLEAHWARLMFNRGILWTYEPQTFKWDDGWYLPDFYLPRDETWLEVKPFSAWEWNEFDRLWLPGDRVAAETGKTFVVVFGLPGRTWNGSRYAYCYRCVECSGRHTRARGSRDFADPGEPSRLERAREHDRRRAEARRTGDPYQVGRVTIASPGRTIVPWNRRSDASE